MIATKSAVATIEEVYACLLYTSRCVLETGDEVVTIRLGQTQRWNMPLPLGLFAYKMCIRDRLGEMYLYGNLVEVNLEVAREYFAEALEIFETEYDSLEEMRILSLIHISV